MELVTSKKVHISQADISDAVLNLLFKKRPELRPAGTSADQHNVEFVVNRKDDKIGSGYIVTASVTIESISEELAKEL